MLDLGAGTGLVAALVADAFPNARLTLVDLAPAMLAQARDRLAGHAPGRSRLLCLDLTQTFPGGRYDAIVSAIALHHLPEDAKRVLFRRARAALNDPGVFVNADQVLGPTPELDRRYRETWLRQVRALGATDKDVGLALGRMTHDRKATLDDQLAWLHEAGFVEVDCWYKSYEWAVYAGFTSSGTADRGSADSGATDVSPRFQRRPPRSSSTHA